MKKIITLMFLLGTFISGVSAQGSYPGRPMFGTAPNQDNTGRALTYGYAAIGDTVGSTVDTILIIPNNYNKVYMCTVADSAVIAIKGLSTSFTGSFITIIMEGKSTSQWIKFLGYSGLATQWVTSNTKISPAASKRAIITFFCDGTAWIECYRFVQS